MSVWGRSEILSQNTPLSFPVPKHQFRQTQYNGRGGSTSECSTRLINFGNEILRDSTVRYFHVVQTLKSFVRSLLVFLWVQLRVPVPCSYRRKDKDIQKISRTTEFFFGQIENKLGQSRMTVEINKHPPRQVYPLTSTPICYSLFCVVSLTFLFRIRLTCTVNYRDDVFDHGSGPRLEK